MLVAQKIHVISTAIDKIDDFRTYIDNCELPDLFEIISVYTDQIEEELRCKISELEDEVDS